MTAMQAAQLARERFAALDEDTKHELEAALELAGDLQGQFWDALSAFERAVAEALEIDTFSVSASDDWTEFGELTNETFEYVLNDAEEIIVDEEENR